MLRYVKYRKIGNERPRFKFVTSTASILRKLIPATNIATKTAVENRNKCDDFTLRFGKGFLIVREYNNK
jgi:hypothetical protein